MSAAVLAREMLLRSAAMYREAPCVRGAAKLEVAVPPSMEKPSASSKTNTEIRSVTFWETGLTASFTCDGYGWNRGGWRGPWLSSQRNRPGGYTAVE